MYFYCFFYLLIIGHPSLTLKIRWDIGGQFLAVGENLMKLTIERKTPDSQGRQILLLTRYDGTFINEKGKREKKRKRQSLNLYIYHTPKDKSQRDHDLAEKIRAKALV